jgi:small subunit ribosomal protein S16
MSVRIRLKRMGNRNNPFYRIVAINSANPNDGKAIEYLGTYDPKSSTGRVVLKHDRYQYWLSVGAIPSDTVKSLIPRAIEHATTLPKAEETAPPAEAPAEEAATAAAE